MIVTVLLYGVKSSKYSAPRCEVSLKGVKFDFIQDSGLNILDYEWRCPSGIILSSLKIYE